MAGELARCLRAWRDRLDPGLSEVSSHTARRAPGLRREEVAARAGISVNYLTRLEQGRATTPSASVASALARALRLNTTETEHLQTLAGHAEHGARAVERRITPSVRRILDRFDDVPMIVIDPAWTIVEANEMARVMLVDDLIGQNSARVQFRGPRWVEREPEEDERYERDIVADLHVQLARHPDDPALTDLIAELRAKSPRFAALWTDPPAARSESSRKTLHHRLTGDIAVDCDHLEVVGSDLRIVIWTAQPGTPDADALRLVSAFREQPLSVDPAARARA